MVRVLLIIVWLAVTVFALADWARTSEEEMPGRIPRMMWLIILLLTIPSFSIGAIVWLVVRAVARAEARQNGELVEERPMFNRPSRGASQQPAPEPLAPDDDPDFLFKLERDIRRRRAEEEREQNQPRPRREIPRPDGEAGDGPHAATDDDEPGPDNGSADGHGPEGSTDSTR